MVTLWIGGFAAAIGTWAAAAALTTSRDDRAAAAVTSLLCFSIAAPLLVSLLPARVGGALGRWGGWTVSLALAVSGAWMLLDPYAFTTPASAPGRRMTVGLAVVLSLVFFAAAVLAGRAWVESVLDRRRAAAAPPVAERVPYRPRKRNRRRRR